VSLKVESIGRDCDMSLARAVTLLSDSEKRKAAEFQFPFLQKRYVRGRGMLRRHLSNKLWQNPSKIQIAETETGKPYLSEHDVAFNVSHSEELFVVAIADGAESVGVDIELLDREIDFMGVAAHNFTPGECAELAAAGEWRTRLLFFQIWTAKEALMKYTGEGFGIDPGAIDIQFYDHKPVGFLTEEYAHLYLQTIMLKEGEAVCSVVSEEPFELSI
ncbi:MAG: 4'-phosphopantetheinyl transferase superfamily protein, partial [Verrucomicrobiota bacterium]